MTMSAQEISDRLEIDQLLIRYCHAIDQRDWESYRSVYTEDAVIDDITCHCPVVLDRGDGRTEMFFQGLWYVDELVRTPAGWRISARAERGHFHNLPPDFAFE